MLRKAEPLRRLSERTRDARGAPPETIDLVVTWVDGEARQALRQRYAGLESGYGQDAVAPHRFRDNGELRYLLRSVAAYAPWIGRVFVVVSDQQRPHWAVRDHPRLRFIEDSEIFPDPSCLPTFNSHALECNLHRIPDLAEHYLYCNDDMMFGRPVLPEDFVAPSGALQTYFTRGLSPRPPTNPRANAHNNAWRTTNGVLDQRYGVEQRPYPSHGPTILRRSLAEQAEQLFAPEFQATMRRRFRSPQDIHPVGLQLYHALYSGAAMAVPSPYRYDFVELRGWRPYLQHLLRALARERPRTFCINDGAGSYGLDLRNFLQQYFPHRSEFERSTASSCSPRSGGNSRP